ncbi:MAG: aspartate aminotransferase [Flavobacteriales bacterium]|jgi:aspartate aminotransferase
MNTVSKTLQRLSESATLAMSRRSRELAEQGIDVISLSLGEPDFNTPDFIKEAAKKAIDDNFTKYPPVNGYLSLRQAISQKFLRDNNLNYTPNQIVVSTGAKQSIANAVLSILNEGDECLLPSPYWVSYEEIVKITGATPVRIGTEIDSDFKVTPAQLEASITEKTRMIIYSSPCNPTGSVYSQSELEALAAVLLKYPNILVISDEIYELINFEGTNFSLAAIEGMYDRTITINGVSKGFAMTGWRIGYMGAPEWIAKACSKMQGQITSAPSGISQKAAEAAVLSNPLEMSYMKDAFKIRRDMVVSHLKKIPGLVVNIPKGAFYVFPDVSALFGKSYGKFVINNADDLCEYLLMDAHVALVTGAAFGADNYIRISYAASTEVLKDALQRIETAIKKLNE